jgi:deazaflavin-dependent oxidoreductase (nitroreductase family)
MTELNWIRLALSTPQSPTVPGFRRSYFGITAAAISRRTTSLGRLRETAASATMARGGDPRLPRRHREHTLRDWDTFNRDVIEEFRATGGKRAGRFTNRPLLLLTTTGARSGLPRTIPLVYSRDGDRLVVIASKGGESTNPDWYHNLLANPTVTVELPGETFRATASIAEGAERRRLFDQQAAQMPFFAEYERTTPRRIPVVVLTRLDSAD